MAVNHFPSQRPTRPEARLFDRIERIDGIEEEELYSLIRRRAQPGILILNQERTVLYLNHDARCFLEGLMSKSRTSRSKEKKSSVDFNQGSKPPLPEIVCQLYDHFGKMIALRLGETEGVIPTVNRICIHEGMVYLLRALLLQAQDLSEAHNDFMILIEKVSQGVRVDQINWTEKLTPRETEVVHLLLEGKTNKEVAVCIDIGEYTVKDHIKRIMKKLEVSTRAGIVAKVLQHHFPA